MRWGTSYTVRTAAVGDRVTQAVLDRHEADEQRGRILTALLTAGVAGVLLAALVAAWLARRTVRPMADTIAMQRRFVADASHELRTPLTLLSTRAQLLSRRLRRDPRVTDARRSTDVDGIVADTRTLTEILDELLTAADTRSRADVDDRRRQRARSRTSPAPRRPPPRRSGVTADGRGPDAAASVEGAPASLRRALTALVDNAVSHASSAVTISVRASGRRVGDRGQ